jgi:hypothetical protein
LLTWEVIVRLILVARSTVNSDVQPNSVQSEDEKKSLPALSLPSPSEEQFVGAGGKLVELNACQGITKATDLKLKCLKIRAKTAMNLKR